MEPMSVIIAGNPQPITDVLIEMNEKSLIHLLDIEMADGGIEDLLSSPDIAILVASLDYVNNLSSGVKKKIHKSRQTKFIICLEKNLKSSFSEAARYKPDFIITPDQKDYQIGFILENLLCRKHKTIDKISLPKIQSTKQSLNPDHFLDVIIDNADVWISFTGIDQRISVWNKAAENITGYSKQEVIGGNKIINLILPDQTYRLAVIEEIKNHLSKNPDEALIFNILTRNGITKTLSVSIKPIINEKGNIQGHITVAYDITNRTLKDKEAKARLQEKEIFIKEIHHRVKNNLQVMTSLINLQLNFIDDGFTNQVLRETQNRLRTMALIQETLYHSQDFTRLNFQTFLKNYFNESNRSYPEIDLDVQINFADIYLDIDSAMTMGLLVNEMATNAFKYAFPVINDPKITIDLFQTLHNRILFVFADNGTGMNKNIDFNNPETLGLQLIQILASQLEGEIELERKNGTKYILRIDSDKILVPTS